MVFYKKLINTQKYADGFLSTQSIIENTEIAFCSSIIPKYPQEKMRLYSQISFFLAKKTKIYTFGNQIAS